MNFISGDMQLALAHDRMNRLQAEAESHRRARLANGQRRGVVDRLAPAIDRGLASIRESFKLDRRPRIPAI
ncbi:MAG TPA: hypothetical protein VLA91_00725 [Acidimicrobiia bacterium]|nr:hypothetical protein [Acidimicrobiia bacterium]